MHNDYNIDRIAGNYKINSVRYLFLEMSLVHLSCECMKLIDLIFMIVFIIVFMIVFISSLYNTLYDSLYSSLYDSLYDRLLSQYSETSALKSAHHKVKKM